MVLLIPLTTVDNQNAKITFLWYYELNWSHPGCLAKAQLWIWSSTDPFTILHLLPDQRSKSWGSQRRKNVHSTKFSTMYRMSLFFLSIYIYITSLNFLLVLLWSLHSFMGYPVMVITIIFEAVFCLIISWISYICNKMRSVYNVSLSWLPVSSCSISACRDTTLPTHFAFYDASPDLAKSSEQICWN